MNSSMESRGAKQNPTIMRKNKNPLTVERAGTTAFMLLWISQPAS
jgi:hypothetical protein